MSERTSGQETGPTAPSGLPSAATGTSDAERIAALEAEVAEARGILRRIFDACGPDTPYADSVRTFLARPADIAAARVIDPEQDRLARIHAAIDWIGRARTASYQNDRTTHGEYFNEGFDAGVAYARESRS